jgi:aryl-alcohol dehydrogenase-like predicted oxidoreductase
MGFSQSYGPAKDEESLETLAKAVELGCTFWDSAVVYGAGHNESLIGRFFKENPGSRENVFIASKCGIEVSSDVDFVVTKYSSLTVEFSLVRL